MTLFLFIKFLLVKLYLGARQVFLLAKLHKENPNCKFYPGAKISNSLFGNFNVIFNDVLIDSCEIGDHTYIQKKSSIFNAKIGKFCSIASNVSIGPGRHKIDSVSTHPVFYLNETPLVKKYSKKDLFEVSELTVIGNDVWIGERVIVMDGVKIGTGAVIASGSIVTKDVPSYAIIGGVPAKLIRYRFSSEIINDLLKSEWWNLPESVLEKEYFKFIDINDFFKI